MPGKLIIIVVGVAVTLALLLQSVGGTLFASVEQARAQPVEAPRASSPPCPDGYVLLPDYATVSLGAPLSWQIVAPTSAITTSWTITGYPESPRVIAGSNISTTVTMDRPGVATASVVVETESTSCVLRAQAGFAQPDALSLDPTTARRPAIWDPVQRRIVAEPVTIEMWVRGSYPLGPSDPSTDPPDGSPSPFGGTYQIWNGVLGVDSAPVPGVTITATVQAPGILTALPARTDERGNSSLSVGATGRGTALVTATAASRTGAGAVQASALVTFVSSGVDGPPEVRWAGEEAVLEKYFGPALQGRAVQFTTLDGSGGCLMSPLNSCSLLYSVVDQYGFARALLLSHDQGETRVRADVLSTFADPATVREFQGVTYLDGFEADGSAVLDQSEVRVWFLQLEDVALGIASLPDGSALEAALGLTSGTLTLNQVGALHSLFIGSQNPLSAAPSLNAGVFVGAVGSTTTHTPNLFEPGSSDLASGIQAIVNSPPREDQLQAVTRLYDGVFNVTDPATTSPGGDMSGTLRSTRAAAGQRQLLRSQVRGWFMSSYACDRPARVVHDASGDVTLPAGRCVLPDDWPYLATVAVDRAESFDVMDDPGDTVKSGPRFAGDLPVFSDSRLGAYYRYARPSSNPFAVVPAQALAAGYPVIGPSSMLNEPYTTSGVVFDPMVSLAPRDEVVAGAGLRSGCNELNAVATSGQSSCRPGEKAGVGPLPDGAYTQDATGLHMWARQSRVPNGLLNWYDAPMPPALVRLQSGGPVTGTVEAADKALILRTRDVVDVPDASTRTYGWRGTAPFYDVEIPAAPQAKPSAPQGGYAWDSWGLMGTPAGPYQFWRPVGSSRPGELDLYTDNNGRAMAFLTDHGDFDLSPWRNADGGVDIPRAIDLGSTALQATADYPYLRDHQPVTSGAVSVTWTSQWGRVLTAEPMGSGRLRVTASITTVDGLCPSQHEIQWSLQGSTGTGARIVETSDGPSGVQGTDAAVTRNLSGCRAWVTVEALGPATRVRAQFVPDKVERFWPEVQGIPFVWSINFSTVVTATVSGGDVSLGGPAGAGALGPGGPWPVSAALAWTKLVSGQPFQGELHATVTVQGTDLIIRLDSLDGQIGTVVAQVPLSYEVSFRGSQTKQFTINRTIDVAGLGSVPVTVAVNIAVTQIS